MKYAVIALAGRQFMVKEGETLQVTRQTEPEVNVLFYHGDDQKVVVGKPYINNVLVNLEKVEDKQAKKVSVARFRAKSRHRRTVGHRQPVSVFKVTSIKEN